MKYENALTYGKIIIVTSFYLFFVVFATGRDKMGNFPMTASLSTGDAAWYKSEKTRDLVTSGSYLKSDYLDVVTNRFFDSVQKRLSSATEEREFNKTLIYALCGISIVFLVAGVSTLLATYKTRKQKEMDDKTNLDKFNRMQAIVNELEKGYRDNFYPGMIRLNSLQTPKQAVNQSLAKLTLTKEIGGNEEKDDLSNAGDSGSSVNGPGPSGASYLPHPLHYSYRSSMKQMP